MKKGDKFKNDAKAPVTVSKVRVRRNKRRVKRNGKSTLRKRRTTSLGVSANPRRKRKKATKVTRRKRRVTKSAAPKRRKRRKTTAVKRRRKRVAKRTAPKRRKARRTKKKTKSTRRRVRRNGNTTMKNSRRRVRRNGRKGGFKLFRRNSFMANLKAVLKTGLFVTTGFLAHRIITNLVTDKLLATVLPDNVLFQTWKKPLAGLGVLGIGVAVSGAVAKKNAMELGAGMVASFLQSLIVAGLNAAGQPQLVSAVGGYSNSRAWDLRGVRRRGRRGLRGLESHAVSIGPRYTPIGQFQQAAAGVPGYQQAAAGTLGEYFTASQGVGEYFQSTGEYFAPAGMKGVGGYEPAGQLAMQASAGTHQVIRDGIRPDGDLDRALDLAEAAAGLGDVPEIHRVPQRSQWIPNGPLWAGETAVKDTQATSEISAGILSRMGGNGILSGG